MTLTLSSTPDIALAVLSKIGNKSYILTQKFDLHKYVVNVTSKKIKLFISMNGMNNLCISGDPLNPLAFHYDCRSM